MNSADASTAPCPRRARRARARRGFRPRSAPLARPFQRWSRPRRQSPPDFSPPNFPPSGPCPPAKASPPPSSPTTASSRSTTRTIAKPSAPSTPPPAANSARRRHVPFTDTQGPRGPRNTPLVDGDRVYAVSCRGELRCLRTTDGALVWRANYVTNFGAVFIGEQGAATGATRHGNDGSPLVDGPHLIAQVGGTNDAGRSASTNAPATSPGKAPVTPPATPPPSSPRSTTNPRSSSSTPSALSDSAAATVSNAGVSR